MQNENRNAWIIFNFVSDWIWLQEKRKLGYWSCYRPFIRVWPVLCHSTSPPSGALSLWLLCGQKQTSIDLPPSSGELAAMQRWFVDAGGNPECWGSNCLLEHVARECRQQTLIGWQTWRPSIHTEDNGASNQKTGLSQQAEFESKQEKLHPNRTDGWDFKFPTLYRDLKHNSEW